MSFLSDLGDQINSQFNLGENHTTSLDADIDGQTVKYGSLGDFASQFDQSAERRYVEEGYLRRDPYNTDPKQFEALWQEPGASVIVKKRMFSSIAENYRPDFMDTDEKLYYKALRILFNNKCNQISSLEKLSKIQKVTAAVGNICDQLIPWIISLTDTANNGYGNGGSLFGGSGSNPFTTQSGNSFIQSVDRLRTLHALNQPNRYTTWIKDPSDLFQSTFGGGNGVIEITNFTNITTTTGVDLKQPGSFTINIEDPYEAMLITDYDIEVALSDATNLFYNKKSFQFGVTSANEVIANQQKQLNTIRNARNASPITFKIDPDTLLSKRVTAIIDRLGVEIQFTYDPLGAFSITGSGGVDVNDDYLRGGNIAGYDGLDKGPGYTGFPWTKNATTKSHGFSELHAFQIIITTIFQQLALLANSAGSLQANNKSYNYARKKLRFNFSGKLIIQPMDVIHIYMSSKSQFDNKVLSGLSQMFSGVGILQNITNTLTGIKNASDILFNPSANISVAAEKSIFVGPDFPNYLWATIRSEYVNEKEGVHVFGGVVESAVDNWSGGKFTVDVSGKDNTLYFDQGKINFKPGADKFNGLMFDPLTPFKSNFDVVSVNNAPTSGVPQLLDENMYLLSPTGKGSMVKYKQGSLAGQKATHGNYIQDQSIDPNSGRLTRVFYAPDGLVYKWKQGIGTFVRYGSSNQLNDPNMVGAFNNKNEPFAGLDIMNVISLLITGVPYNFATFYKATANLSGFSGDPQSKQSASYSYLQSLQIDLGKSNALWGNFIPFKNLIMNEAAIADAMRQRFSANTANSDLDKKIKELADLHKRATMLGAVNVLSSKIPGIADQTQGTDASNLSTKIDNLVKDIDGSISHIQEETDKFYNNLDRKQALDSNYLIDGKNDPNDSKARKEIRRQINYLTRRMSYDVRGNRDKNLFIVDDYYDADYDIAAFNKSLTSGVPMYSSEFTSVREKIINVADLLNLEVFCDSQGHIRVRSPQYNRMPSSVFHRMIYLKQTLGVQVFPAFLNNLFTDQLDSLRNAIEIIEDQIRLDCAILDQGTGTIFPTDIGPAGADIVAQTFIANTGITSGQGGTFSFISSSSGIISNIANLIKQANQDQTTDTIDQSLGNFSGIKAAGIATRQLFDNAERYTILSQALQTQNQNANGSNVNSTLGTSIFQTSVVQELITRIHSKSGQVIVSKDYLTPAQANQPIEIDTGQTIDFFKVTDELSTYMQKWQAAVKQFYHAIKNTAEYRSLDDDATTSNSLQNPGLFSRSYIPEVFEHMIEDESYDDYGPGSGTRYVIKRSQIRNISISENAPPWTSVEVQGNLGGNFAENAGAAGLESFPGGGNAQVTAMAIDYDMWRNYGFKQPSVIKVPFLKDPRTQCGPYAAMILTRNRSNILKGSLTISGNEYMQPGEVIYLEDRNLLFYVNSVKHSFQAGHGFTTALELTYGHSIGEYIPTYMDTVGKLLYKNQEGVNTIIHRQDSSTPEKNFGVIQLDPKVPSAPVVKSSQEPQFINSFSSSNADVINNILYNTAYMINANESKGSNITASIELRIYHDNAKGVNSDLMKAANNVKDQLTGVSVGPQNSFSQNQPVQNASIDKKWINVVTINLDSATDRRSPSQKAIDAARNQAANSSTNTSNPSPSNPTGNDDGTDAAAIAASNASLRTSLYGYIIDCWVIFTKVPANQV